MVEGLTFGEAVKELERFYEEEGVETVEDREDCYELDFQSLELFDIDLADYIQNNPTKGLSAAAESLIQLEESEDPRVKITNVSEDMILSPNQLRSDKIGNIIGVKGRIVAADKIHPIIVSAVFECTMCGELIEKEQDSGGLESPYKCPDCGSKNFGIESKKFIDFQEMKIEDEGQEIQVNLYGSMVDNPPNLKDKEAKIIGTVDVDDSGRTPSYILEANGIDLIE